MSATGAVAFTQRSTPDEPGEVVIWRTLSVPPERRVLPFGRSPMWSSDGRAIAFISERFDDEVCVVADVETSDDPVTLRLGDAVTVASVSWMPKKNRLLVVCAPADADGSVADGALRPEAVGWPVRRTTKVGVRMLALVDPDVVDPTWIDLGPVSVWEAAGLPDGRIVAVVSDDPTESGWYGARLSIIDGDREEPLYRSSWQIACPVASPTGDRIAFIEGWASDRGHLAGDVAVVDPVTGALRVIEGADVGLDATAVQWLDATTVWVSGWTGFRRSWATIDTRTGRRESGGTLDSALAIVRPPSRSIARHATITVRADGEPVLDVLDVDESALRPDAGASAGGHSFVSEVVRWSSSDGLEIEGLLMRGIGRPPSEQRLIVMIHGGPANLWTDVPPPGARALLASGYSVLLPNPRGSVGRGQAFARANLGDPGGRELDDVLSGAAACRELGLVKDAPPGVVGGSYGGYLAACAAIFSKDIGAAVAMFGHPDLLSARLAANNGAFYDRLLATVNGTFDGDLAHDRSPAFHVDAGVVPMLLLHGDRDACTPLGQSEELFGALVAAGVEAELVVYPGAGHGLRGVRTQEDVWGRTIAWFDRHLEEAAAC